MNTWPACNFKGSGELDSKRVQNTASHELTQIVIVAHNLQRTRSGYAVDEFGLGVSEEHLLVV
jgi:hypothetical protein